MTDIEMTKLCAQAMGEEFPEVREGKVQLPVRWTAQRKPNAWMDYDPLHDDAQAIALVKRFRLTVTPGIDEEWIASGFYGKPHVAAVGLNRAIVECVVKMQAERSR